MSSKVVCFPSQRAARAVGEYNERDHLAARKFITNAFSRSGQRLVCEKLRGSAGIRKNGSYRKQSREVLGREALAKTKVRIF